MNKNMIPPGMKFGVYEPEIAAKYSGLQLLQMMIKGEQPAPPIAKLLNFVLSEADLGRAVFRGAPTFDHYNPANTVHGGWPAAILDSAMGCAVQSMLPAGTFYTTIEFKVNLVRALSENSGEVVCESKIIYVGRTTATSGATLKLANGKLAAHGTCTCAIIKMP